MCRLVPSRYTSVPVSEAEKAAAGALDTVLGNSPQPLLRHGCGLADNREGRGVECLRQQNSFARKQEVVTAVVAHMDCVGVRFYERPALRGAELPYLDPTVVLDISTCNRIEEMATVEQKARTTVRLLRHVQDQPV